MKSLIRLLLEEQSDLGPHCLPKPGSLKTIDHYGSKILAMPQGKLSSAPPTTLDSDQPTQLQKLAECFELLSISTVAAPVAEWVRLLNFSALNHWIISSL